MAGYPEETEYLVATKSRGGMFVRDLLDTLESYAWGMWRYRWWAAIVIWIVAAAAWVTIYRMPPIYQADARVLVDTENAIRPLTRDIATSSDLMSEVSVVTREILSRPNLASIAEETGLNSKVRSDEQYDRMLTSLREEIKIDRDRENVFSISFQYTEQAKALAVVESVVEFFIERSIGSDRNESSSAQDFLRSEIQDYESRLTAAEDKLAQFKRQNVALMPDKRGDYFQKLQTAEEELAAARGKLRLAQERRIEMIRQMEGEELVFGIVPLQPPESSDDANSTDVRIRKLEVQLAELRLQYTDKHPRIGQVLETLELLKAQRDLERMADSSDPSNTQLLANPLDANPVYQNMRMQLANLDVEIASLNSEVGYRQTQVDELRTLVDTVPQVEAELGRLNRDYDVVKIKYDQLVAQLEKARIGEAVEQHIDDVKIRVIDPPFAGTKAVGPRRNLFIVAGTIFAIGLGFALAFLLNQLNLVYFSSREISAGSGLPVIGVVSLFLAPEAMRRRKLNNLLFSLTGIVFIASFVLVFLLSETASEYVRRYI